MPQQLINLLELNPEVLLNMKQEALNTSPSLNPTAFQHFPEALC